MKYFVVATRLRVHGDRFLEMLDLHLTRRTHVTADLSVRIVLEVIGRDISPKYVIPEVHIRPVSLERGFLMNDLPQCHTPGVKDCTYMDYVVK